MNIRVEEVRKLRRASACIRDGGVIHIKIPRHWPKATKLEVIESLTEKLTRKDTREKALLNKHAIHQNRITLHNQIELERYVHQLNAQTLNAPLGKIRFGHSRYNHLAQVNLRTKTMTVSKYCLQNVPADALRYLIVHELAHYFEAGHGPQFWALVARHVPDYRLQSRIIKAFHHQTVIAESLDRNPSDVPLATAIKPSLIDQSTIEAPASPALRPVTKQAKHKDTESPSGWPGVFKQLLLWAQS